MKKIEKVAVIGAGTMGRRIAFQCLINDVSTQLFDISPEAARDAQDAVKVLIEERVSHGRLPSRLMHSAPALLSICHSLEKCVSNVELVIETVSEDLDLKRDVFKQMLPHLGKDTLIGTNTSSLKGSQLADSTGRPEKFFNFNFGPPDDPKVEVMSHPQIDKSTIEAAMNFVEQIHLIPILVKKEIMGYVTNRIWRAVKKEVLFLLNGGYATAEDIDRGWMLEWGTSMGPCGFMDIIGLDIIRDVEKVYYNASKDDSDNPPEILLEMISQGRLGVKSGEGFYKYPNPAYKEPGWLKHGK